MIARVWEGVRRWTEETAGLRRLWGKPAGTPFSLRCGQRAVQVCAGPVCTLTWGEDRGETPAPPALRGRRRLPFS